VPESSMPRRNRAAASPFLWGTCLVGVLGVSAQVSDAEPLPPRSAGEISDASCTGGEDSDEDGLSDACEQTLAERFAPIVYHSSDESNFPTNVDAFLPLTTLALKDDACVEAARPMPVPHPTQLDLLGREHVACDGRALSSEGTRSAGKHRTFFLADVDDAARAGSSDPREWTTYFHAYPNDIGGVTLQYWRFYAYNDAANDHGGDWEGLHVVLSRMADGLGVRNVRLLTHDRLSQPALGRFQFEGTHVRVFSEGGGHATRFSGDEIEARGCRGPGRCTLDLDNPSSFVRQETWTSGRVTGQRDGTTGPLVNLGSKETPMNGQAFVRYAGLWGSPGVFYATSGFWGPAYNETSLRADGFVSAWCEGMAHPSREECYPRDTVP
jgi:hypothetical protein